MSEAENQSEATDVSTNEEREKEVIVTAYSQGEYDDKREFIHETFNDLVEEDVNETYEDENHDVHLEFAINSEDDDGYEFDITSKIEPWGRYKQEAFLNYFEEYLEDDNEIPEFLTLVDEVNTVEKHSHSAGDIVHSYLDECLSDSELEEFGFENTNYGSYIGAWSRQIDDESVDADPDSTITQYCRVHTTGSIEPRRPLIHQSNRTREDRYESDEEVWSFQIKVHIECQTDEELDGISKAIVPTLYDTLWSVDNIDSVRLESCEQSVKKKGECYNI